MELAVQYQVVELSFCGMLWSVLTWHVLAGQDAEPRRLLHRFDQLSTSVLPCPQQHDMHLVAAGSQHM